MKVGARIRQLRRKSGALQGDIARTAGIKPAALSRVERGHVDPRVSTVEKIASALGVPTAWLFMEDAQSEESNRVGI